MLRFGRTQQDSTAQVISAEQARTAGAVGGFEKACRLEWAFQHHLESATAERIPLVLLHYCGGEGKREGRHIGGYCWQ